MGAFQGAEFAGMVSDGSITLERAVTWHLTANHFPPVPVSMVEPCLRALRAVNEDCGDFRIELPAGATWRGEPTAPAWAIVEGHHLEEFLGALGEPRWADED